VLPLVPLFRGLTSRVVGFSFGGHREEDPDGGLGGGGCGGPECEGADATAAGGVEDATTDEGDIEEEDVDGRSDDTEPP